MALKKSILYASSFCSKKVENYLFISSAKKPFQAVHKFHRLIIEGLAAHDKKCKVDTLCAIPVITKSHKKIFWNVPSETDKNVRYNYVPMINLPGTKEISIFVYSFFKVIIWNFFNRKSDKIVVSDPCSLTISTAVLLASKLTGIRIIALVTDLPAMAISTKIKKGFKFKVYRKVAYLAISHFDKYIFLTPQMNKVVNSNNRPFMVMEGLVDVEMGQRTNRFIKNNNERVLIYAGGIQKRYGIEKLLKAFMKLKGEDLRLHIYGQGDFEEEMLYYNNIDHRIIYKGVVPNEKVVEQELQAVLLINPRPTDEIFTQFSFPSKNMEYMVSGTPLVTTKLPGMPKEYYNFVYLFDDESITGMTKTLEELLNKSETELTAFGEKAKKFVLTEKANTVQGKRILEFM
jgi:glycosyltransferase involved in cell wall biosynthesis